MGIWQSFAGTVSIGITSADIPGALKSITDRNIFLKDVRYKSDLSVSASVYRKDYKRVEQILSVRGDRCVLSGKTGIVWSVHQVQRRPVLLIGIIVLAALTIYVPSKVFFIQVRGNETVSSDRIICTAHNNGLSFGSNRANIRNEQLKNFLLEEIPELDWVGITSSGCVATIEVRENLTKKTEEPVSRVSSLVAACDGVVESVTVTNGTPLCKPGQVVRRGQVLISGYQDHGLLIKASNAQGEIYARTSRFLQVVSLSINDAREAFHHVSTKFSLQIGKNQINFYKDSGISPTGCVKMYEKKYLMLPGGFQLPVAFITEKTYHGQSQPVSDSISSFSWADEFADQYILNQMIAGEVISKERTWDTVGDLFVFSGEYACREQIGQKRIEESLKNNGENS